MICGVRTTFLSVLECTDSPEVPNVSAGSNATFLPLATGRECRPCDTGLCRAWPNATLFPTPLMVPALWRRAR
jgi:hypothetical protein